MDWAKIKTILILMLVLTNLMLATNYVLSTHRFQLEREDSGSTVQELYRAKGVEISASIPEVPQRLPGFEIAQLTFQRSYIDLVLGTGVKENRSRYSNERFTAYVENTKLAISETPYIEDVILSKNLKLSNPVTITDAEIATLLDSVDNLFQRYYMNIDYQEAEVYEIDDLLAIRLYQQFGGYTNDESILFVWFHEKRPIGFYLENIVSRVGEDTEKYAIIPVNEALYAGLPRLQGRDELRKIEIVYKLNDDSLPVRDIVQGEALPYYKFSFESGAPIYVRAIRSNH